MQTAQLPPALLTSALSQTIPADATTLGIVDRYMTRPPITPERMLGEANQAQLIYRSNAVHPRHQANFRVFDPLDFLAEVSGHIPDAHDKTTLFYGWYSNRTRGYRKQHGLLGNATPKALAPQRRDPVPLEARRSWTRLIRQVSEVDPLVCARAAGARVEMEGEPPGSFQSDLAGLALTVLLYLGGEPDLVRQVHPGAKLARESRIRRRDPDRRRDLRAPTLYAVGSAFRAAIQRWEIKQRDQVSLPVGRSVRPQVRRPHAHLYWTRPGRTALRVRFLLPIPIKGGTVPDESPQPTERPVR